MEYIVNYIFYFVDTPENSEESSLKLRFIYVVYEGKYVFSFINYGK